MAEPTSRRSSLVDEAQTPLLENMVVGVPPVFQGLTREIDQLGEQPLLGPKAEYPLRE
jgi:tubulin gamma